MFTLLLALSLLMVLIGAAWFMFRPKKAAINEFSDEWRAILDEKVKFYADLDTEGKTRFEQDCIQFLNDVKVTGRGFDVEEEDKLLVAASAVIPLFGFPGWRFRNVNEVILFSDRFNADFNSEDGENRNILGMVGNGVLNNKMILSKPALHHGFDNKTDKLNVGIHEFVHLIDMADGDVDGLPEKILENQFSIPWLKLTHKKMQEILEGKSDINPYALTNEAEFFSVVSEYFFSRPHLLQRKHPELFDLLEEIYNQDLS